MVSQSVLAQTFAQLHHQSAPLVLPNAWDAISARIFEDIGFQAVATTSAGIAASLGYPDGERVPFNEVVVAIDRIVRSVRIPVSVDIEAGYGRSPADVCETVKQVLAVGAVGINIEDIEDGSLRHIDRQADLIECIKKTADLSGIPLFINARTDSLYKGGNDVEQRFDDTFKRARAYQQAGADGIFVFGFHDKQVIRKLISGITCPLNVLLGPESPPVHDLQSLGVARVSMGPGAFRAAMGIVQRVGREFLSMGTCQHVGQFGLSFMDIQRLLQDGRRERA
ncbi:isocitrate lyase/PEP mutase family protein [Ferroacidibacillus organovorans]|uniref:Dihydrouridine synthase n=1 Tax=Ferroacidibacillus organovorans TaxID=1765683 RepID=A0A853K7P8_9BACL|nr:isocitrate lyase/phosphoenolpyruvate mutase family protein [Ferroacidibacillus organovorans]KYP80820.1 hypothetical protein AYJ22_09770 [Ferroacidibacillus organovorans]OAG92203.1 hypothetical protein AYW79_13355 [Ferroacidibacillus organovorans]